MRTIHHGETVDGRRFTIVGVYDKEAEKNKVKFGVAICGPRDNFARKVGRSIAEGRALKNPTLVKDIKYELPEDKEGFKNLSQLGCEILENIEKDPYLFQEILTKQNKEVEDERKRIRLERLNKQNSI